MKPIAYILAAAVIALGVFVLSMSGLKAATDPRSSIGPRVIGNAELLALENLNQVMNTFVQIANAQITISQREIAALEQANALKAQELTMEALNTSASISARSTNVISTKIPRTHHPRRHGALDRPRLLDPHRTLPVGRGPQPASIP